MCANGGASCAAYQGGYIKHTWRTVYPVQWTVSSEAILFLIFALTGFTSTGFGVNDGGGWGNRGNSYTVIFMCIPTTVADICQTYRHFGSDGFDLHGIRFGGRQAFRAKFCIRQFYPRCERSLRLWRIP